MIVKCNVCKKDINTELIRIDKVENTGTCNHCGSIFLLSSQPKSITIKSDDERFVITRGWFNYRPIHKFFFINFIFILSVIIQFSFEALKLNGSTIELFKIIVLLMIFPFVILNIILIYSLIANFVNKTVITVSKDGTTRVKHGPIPFMGQKVRIDKTDRILMGGQTGDNSGYFNSYRVYIVSNRGVKRKLISGLPKSEEARFISDEIALYLGMK